MTGLAEAPGTSRRSGRRLLRWGLLLASTMIGLAVIALVVAMRGAPTVETVDRSRDLPAVFAARPEGFGSPGSLANDLDAIHRVPLPTEVASSFFPIGRSGNVYDRHAYFRGSENRFDKTFREHPAGGFVVETTSTGLRESAPPRSDRPELRILVTGDSHTEGVVATHESFANLLEAGLRARGTDAEVLNAGRGGYHVLNYPGVLELHRALEPDVFVVTIFGGNDLFEPLAVLRYLQGLGPPIKNAVVDDGAGTSESRPAGGATVPSSPGRASTPDPG